MPLGHLLTEIVPGVKDPIQGEVVAHPNDLRVVVDLVVAFREATILIANQDRLVGLNFVAILGHEASMPYISRTTGFLKRKVYWATNTPEK